MATPEKSSVTIVLIGRFNPADFLPHALAAGDVISDAEAAKAVLSIFVPDHGLTYKLEWGDVHVQPTRFQVSCEKPPFVRAADLIAKTLTDVVSNFGIHMFGINYHADYVLPVDVRDKIGRRLAPANAWGPWGQEVERSLMKLADDPLHGGVVDIAMRCPKDDDREYGWVEARVRSSTAYKSGITFIINDHYQRKPKNTTGPALSSSPAESKVSQRMLDRLGANFDDSISRSITITQSVLGAN